MTVPPQTMTVWAQGPIWVLDIFGTSALAQSQTCSKNSGKATKFANTLEHCSADVVPPLDRVLLDISLPGWPRTSRQGQLQPRGSWGTSWNWLNIAGNLAFILRIQMSFTFSFIRNPVLFWFKNILKLLITFPKIYFSKLAVPSWCVCLYLQLGTPTGCIFSIHHCNKGSLPAFSLFPPLSLSHPARVMFLLWEALRDKACHWHC